jgi:stage II sporulation protein D
MPGDRAILLLDTKGRPRALTLNANYDGAAFDRTSSFSSWTRSYRAADLVTSIARRNPITTLIDLRPTGTDASKRVTGLEVVADNGRTFTLTGLPIRWSLNVPDNLFVISKSKDSDGMDRYTFFGKGWGHGTGMCQVGTYGMAFRGWNAERIVKHYYTGVEIVDWKP